MTLDDFLGHFPSRRKNSAHDWHVPCPAHNDDTQHPEKFSLHVTLAGAKSPEDPTDEIATCSLYTGPGTGAGRGLGGFGAGLGRGGGISPTSRGSSLRCNARCPR